MGWIHKTWFAGVLLLILGFLNFGNALNNEFLMDDFGFFNDQHANISKAWQYFIPDRHKVLGIESEKTDKSYYRPLAHVVPTVAYQFFGMNPIGYHVMNLLLFTLAAFLLYLFLRQYFASALLGLIAAGGYLVHPINGIIVNYCTASVFALQAAFMLAALYALLCRLSRLWAVIFCILALMCHESAMALPLYACMLVLFTKGWRQVLNMTWPLWVTVSGYFVFRLVFSSFNNSIFYSLSQANVDVLTYVATVIKLSCWYLAKLIYPLGIVFMWATPAVTQVAGWLFLGVALAGIMFGIIVKFKRPVLNIGLLWLASGFLPLLVGAIVSFRQGFLIEPHWMVFASIGFFIVIADLCVWALTLYPAVYMRALMAVVLGGWMGSSWVYNDLWSSEKGYCLYWRAFAPNFKAPSYFLASGYEKEGNYAMARSLYQDALLNRYKDWLVYVNMGQLSLKQKNYAQARQDFQQALALENRSSEAMIGLGHSYLNEKDYQQARYYYQLALKMNRRSLFAWHSLASLEVQESNFNQAVDIYKRILSLNARDEIAMSALLGIFIQQKNQDEMLKASAYVLTHSQQARNLTMAGSVFSFLGKNEEAQASFAKAIRVEPRFVDAYVEAIKFYKKVQNQPQVDKLIRQLQQLGIKVNAP